MAPLLPTARSPGADGSTIHAVGRPASGTGSRRGDRSSSFSSRVPSAFVGLFIAAYMLIDIPSPNDLLRAQTSTIQYSDGGPIAQLYEQNRTDVDLTDVPEGTRNAVLAAENRSFYSDPGYRSRDLPARCGSTSRATRQSAGRRSHSSTSRTCT